MRILLSLWRSLARRVDRPVRRQASCFAECLDRALVDAPAALGLRTFERALTATSDEPVAAETDHEYGL